jgi:hypothetical protein
MLLYTINLGDRRLTWSKQIRTKRNHLCLKAKQMQWLLGRGSTLSTERKFLLDKAVFKPIWTYAVQPWGKPQISISKSSSVSNPLLNASLYINKYRAHEDLQMDTVLSGIESRVPNT